MKFIVFLLFVALFAVYALITGFFWMIGLGILSSIFGEPSLAISYWNSVLVAVVVNFLLGGMLRVSQK